VSDNSNERREVHPQVIDRLARIETHVLTIKENVEKQNGRVGRLEDKVNNRTMVERLVVGLILAAGAIAGYLGGNTH